MYLSKNNDSILSYVKNSVDVIYDDRDIRICFLGASANPILTRYFQRNYYIEYGDYFVVAFNLSNKKLQPAFHLETLLSFYEKIRILLKEN